MPSGADPLVRGRRPRRPAARVCQCLWERVPGDPGVRPTNAVEDLGREESRPSRHECLRHRVLALSRLRHHFFHQFEELVGLDRLGNIAGHSGLDTFVAIAFHGMRRHRDDGS